MALQADAAVVRILCLWLACGAVALARLNAAHFSKKLEQLTRRSSTLPRALWLRLVGLASSRLLASAKTRAEKQALRQRRTTRRACSGPSGKNRLFGVPKPREIDESAT